MPSLRVCRVLEFVPQARSRLRSPTTRPSRRHGGDASVVGSSAATLCEGMPAPPAVMSPPRRAWWHRRDERSNSGGPGCGSRSRRPAFMLEGGVPYDWRGVEPKALGGGTRAPQSASVSTREAKLKMYHDRQAHWDVASTDDRRRCCRGFHQRPSPVKMRLSAATRGFADFLSK